MDEYRGQASWFGEPSRISAACIAQSVLRDFTALIAIFDGYMVTTAAADREARTMISQARASAERGLELSQRLMRTIDPVRP